MTDEEIRIRLSQGEDSATQFKRGSVGIAKLSSELAAFTNAAGGVIFFGVEDDGTICGLSKPDVKQLDSEVANASNDSVARNPILFTFATKEIPYRGIGSGIQRALELYPNIEFRGAPKTGGYFIKEGGA